MSVMDFNQALPQSDKFDLIPDGAVAALQMHVRPGHAGEGGWLRRSKSGDCLMIDAEFTVIEGPFAWKRFWSQVTVGGRTEGQKKAVEISQARLRAMLESAHGIMPDDETREAAAARRVESYGDFDGLRFWAVIGIERGRDGRRDKNTLARIVTPDRPEWRLLEQHAADAAPPESA